MKKSNYALITALYANKTHRGLYSDIYFPIIRYSILKIFSYRKDEFPYSSAENIQCFIKDNFGINIPTIVIANAVRKIYNNSASSIQLKVFEQGNTFQIQQVSNDDSKDIDLEEKRFDEKENEIEEQFKEYISKEGIFDDRVSFVSFITENTDNLLSYFETEDEKQVDEKYYSLVEFLRFLHDNNNELYKVANKFFWGSVIAAFLQSDKPSVNASEDAGKIEYYLDTPIVMGLLELSTPEKEHYCKELKETINAAQGILRVHPITLEEIKSILLSVEQHGANPFSDIAIAKDNHKLTVTDLARKRLNLEANVENIGISIFPIIRSEEIDVIKKKYRGTGRVKALAKQRSRGIESYTKDGFREIHDIFMDDFIKDRRKKKNDDKHIFFVTNNVDLINLCRSYNDGISQMVSVSRLILDLWMYNTKSTNISDLALVEAMAKCIDAHKIDVKNKLAAVSRYYNNSKSNFDEKVYNDFIRQLYRRAKNVINYLESSEEIEVSDYSTWSDGLMSAISTDVNGERERRYQMEKEKSALQVEVAHYNESLKSAENVKAQLIQKNTQLELDKKQLQKDNSNLVITKKGLESDKETLRWKNASLEDENNELKKRLRLKEELDKLKEQIIEYEADIAGLEKKREACFINYPAHVLLIMFIVALSLCIFQAFTKVDIISIASFGTIGAACLTGSITFYTKPNACHLKDKAYQRWESKAENQKYKIILNKKKNAEARKNAITKELNENK